MIFFQIKWICPTAPTRPVAIFGGYSCTACKIFLFRTALFISGSEISFFSENPQLKTSNLWHFHVKVLLCWFQYPSDWINVYSCYFLCYFEINENGVTSLINAISGFDMGDLSEDTPDDLEGLDASAAHVANLLSTEPADSRFFPW